MRTEADMERLVEMARRIRCHIVRTIANAGAGHVGGSLSAADILVALYFDVMQVDPTYPDWPARDRFVLSKGHAATGLYATLAERGYFSTELLNTFGRIDSPLQVHPDMHLLPGIIEVSTGALGQGISVALGMAMAARLDHRSIHVYCLIGDGESQEGQVWEAAASAAHHQVDNLTVILDFNRVQLLGTLEEILDMAPMAEKWRAFNWHVQEIDGHDMPAILAALDMARTTRGRPGIIIAHTVKGKGVSFMEGKAAWHGGVPGPEELVQAIAELEGYSEEEAVT